MSTDPQYQQWTASQYLDDEGWGVLSEDNSIIVRLRENKTEAQCRQIVADHNAALRLQTCIIGAAREQEKKP